MRPRFATRGVKLLGNDAVARDRIQFLYFRLILRLNLITHNILLYQLYIHNYVSLFNIVREREYR